MTGMSVMDPLIGPITDIPKDFKGAWCQGFALVPGIVAFAGGLPIMTEDKVHIGGIGVSGIRTFRIS